MYNFPSAIAIYFLEKETKSNYFEPVAYAVTYSVIYVRYVRNSSVEAEQDYAQKSGIFLNRSSHCLHFIFLPYGLGGDASFCCHTRFYPPTPSRLRARKVPALVEILHASLIQWENLLVIRINRVKDLRGGGSKNIPELQKYDDLICYPVLVIEGLFGH